MRYAKILSLVIFILMFFSQPAFAGKIIDVELIVFQNDTVIEKNVNITEGRYSQVWKSGEYELEFLDKEGKLTGQQSIDIVFGYSGPVFLNEPKPDDNLFDSYFLSYRHPYSPEIKTIMLLHFDKIIFSKNIDIAEYTLPNSAAVCNRNNICEPEKGENIINCPEDCSFSDNANNSWLLTLFAMIAVSATAAIFMYFRRKKEIRPSVAFED